MTPDAPNGAGHAPKGAASYANYKLLEVCHVQPDDELLRLLPLPGEHLHLRLLQLRHGGRGEHRRGHLQLRQRLQLRDLHLRAGLRLQRVMVDPV